MIQKYSFLVLTILAFWFAWWVFFWFVVIWFVDLSSDVVGFAFWAGIVLIPIVFGWLWTKR